MKDSELTLGKSFNFRDGLPTGLVLAKPIEQINYDPSIIQSPDILQTRKWNGWRIITTITPGEEKPQIKMYTDGIRKDGSRGKVDAYLPHVVKDLQKLNLPPWTILVGEAIAEQNGKERLGFVGKILGRHKVEEAINLQDQLGRLKLILHGMICWNNQWLENIPFTGILSKLKETVPQKDGEGWIKTITPEITTLSQSQSNVRKYEHEGLVLYNPDYRFTWRLNGPDGDNPRPAGAYKWKPQVDGDFFISEPRMSVKRPGMIKDVMLNQIGPDGRAFKCGRLGNFRKNIDKVLQETGCVGVMEVKCDGRTPAGKLVSPKFLRLRDDKLPTQCYHPRSYDEAQYVKQKIYEKYCLSQSPEK